MICPRKNMRAEYISQQHVTTKTRKTGRSRRGKRRRLGGTEKTIGTRSSSLRSTRVGELRPAGAKPAEHCARYCSAGAAKRRPALQAGPPIVFAHPPSLCVSVVSRFVAFVAFV